MALSESSVKVRQSVGGAVMLALQRPDSRLVQAVGLCDDAGEHIGFEAAPLFVESLAFEHREIHEGDAFSWSEVITLGSAATQDYLITVADNEDWPHFAYAVDASFGVTVDLYEGADRTGTTIQTAYNRNRNSANTAGMTIHKGHSSGTTDGTRIFTAKSGTGAAGGRLSGSSAEATERILKQNTKYIFRVTSAAASNDISIRFNWYEHTFPA